MPQFKDAPELVWFRFDEEANRQDFLAVFHEGHAPRHGMSLLLDGVNEGAAQTVFIRPVNGGGRRLLITPEASSRLVGRDEFGEGRH